MESVYIGLIAFAAALVVIGLVYHPRPTPRPYTELRDPLAWKRNRESRWS